MIISIAPGQFVPYKNYCLYRDHEQQIWRIFDELYPNGLTIEIFHKINYTEWCEIRINISE